MHPRTAPAIAWLSAALVLGALPACKKRTKATPKTGVTEVRIEGNTNEHWKRAGFTKMVSPLRFGTTPDDKDVIEVWLKVPDGKTIGVRRIEEQKRHVLVYPPGTIADRVEQVARPDGPAIVNDVRGTDILAGGEESFHDYRREGDHLVGYAWKRDDRAQESEATDLLVEIVRKEGTDPRRQARVADNFRKLNRCGACHVHEKPEKAPGEKSPLPNRASDAMGFYAVQTVLDPISPVERSRPKDPNIGDPYIRFTCASGEPHVQEGKQGARSLVCEDRSTPHGLLDIEKAVAAGDPHAKAVCASREMLYAHMDEPARRAFAPAFAACKIGPSDAAAPATTATAGGGGRGGSEEAE